MGKRTGHDCKAWHVVTWSLSHVQVNFLAWVVTHVGSILQKCTCDKASQTRDSVQNYGSLEGQFTVIPKNAERISEQCRAYT